MEQRNPFYAPQPPTIAHDQIWNHPLPDPQLHLGNGSLVLPMDSAANPGGLRPTDYPPSHIPNYIATNSVPFHDPYLHSSSTIGSQFPPCQHLCLPLPISNQNISSMVNPQTEIGRAAFKRKIPAMPLAFPGENPSGYYSAGSSSNLHIAPNPVGSIHPKPMAGPPYWPLDSTASVFPSYRNDNLLTLEEASQRNVRSRNNHTLQLGTNPVIAYSSGVTPRHFPEAGSSSGLTMSGQSSHIPIPIAPYGRNLSSDPSFSFEANQPPAGPCFINHAVGTNTSSTLSALHDPVTQGLGLGHNSYNHRSNNYRYSSSCPPVGFSTAPLEVAGPSRVESVASSGFSRPPTLIGRNSYRNGRRNSHRRFQSIFDVDNSRNRWLSEDTVLMDRSTFYDSQNLLDQHRDMRLDIDNMSYEELLALEERIGNVNTGLSEDTISECLQETVHCSSNQSEDDQQEGNCVICLEEYTDQDRLGRLRCRHDFHASCIKDWLLIKNACPICKAAASGDTSKD